MTKERARKNRGLIAILTCAFGVSIIGESMLNIKTNKALADVYNTIDVTQTMQTVDGWGTSLCWWANAVGGWDMEGVSGKTKREEIIDLVFGEDGLDLNIARYNIPGGDDPSHEHMINCRGMSLIKESAEAEYNWSADANQMWVLQSAYASRKGDLHVETFNNSAPYWLTVSKCSSGGKTKADENLAVENYGKFASYYVDVLQYIQGNLGIPVESLEVMNEPSSDYWGANGTQEGCKVTAGDHQSQLIKAVYDEIQKRNLKSSSGDGTSDFIFAAPDETEPGLAYKSYNELSDEVKEIVGKVNYHIYSKSPENRQKVSTLAEYSRDYSTQSNKIWQSEICYGNGKNRPDDYPDNHNSMLDAFDMADDIYGDFYDGKVNAWIIWQIMESELENKEKGCNYGLLHGVYQDVDNTEYSFDLDSMALSRGDYYITKQYYTLGQYSRYIKAGYKIVQSPSSNYVVAISPDKDKVVIVYKNKSENAENQSICLDGFNVSSAKKIYTDANSNWEEGSVEVSGNYVNFSVTAESITTIVIEGSGTTAASSSGMFFKDFSQRSNVLSATFSVNSTDGNYTFYYADSADKLPINGGTEASSKSITVSSADVQIRVDSPGDGTYYGVLEREVNGEKQYSGVACAKKVSNNFTYLTIAGKSNKMSMDGTGYSFGDFYSVADKAFGEDALTGKNWGYTSTDVGEYGSDAFLKSAIYSGTNTLTYKYEVESEKNYTVSLVFLDPWSVSGRSMTIDANGKTATVSDTKSLTSVCIENVSGIADSNDGKYYITITLTGTTSDKNPSVNVISIQDDSQEAQTFYAKGVSASAITQGKTVCDSLPKEVKVITSKGEKSTSNVVYTNINYAEALKANGGQIIVDGIADGKFDFSFTVATNDNSEEILYYIDAGALTPTEKLTNIFNSIKAENSSLINTDAMDKYASGDTDWGRLGSSSDYSEYWANDDDKSASIVEAKYAVEIGGISRNTVQYRLTDLPAGKYSITVGVNVHSWGARDLVMMMGDTVIGTEQKYSDVSEWTYSYEKTNADPVIFTIYSPTSSNAVLSYIIVKKSAENIETLPSPILPNGIDRNTTKITVSGLNKEGALLVLTDDDSNLLAEHIVSGDEATAGQVIIDNLDLSSVDAVYALQYKKENGSSKTVKVEFSPIEVSSPRVTWSANADTITITPSGSSIKAIEYKDGETGDWIDIKVKKFFRATHNGTYYVRLTTTDNTEYIHTVEVTHVDTVEMQVINDLTAWVDEEYTLKLDFSNSPLDIVSVKVSDGEKESDITSTEDEKIFSYEVSDSGHFVITATSSLGTTKTFEIDGCSFEKNPANVEYTVTTKNGVLSIEISSESVGGVEYSYSVDGGDFSTLYQNIMPLIKEGKYTYKTINKVGKEASVDIVYFNCLNDDAQVKISETATHSFTYTLANGLTNLKVTKLNGNGSEIIASATDLGITDCDYYVITAEKDNTIYVTTLTSDITPTEQEGGCSSRVGCDFYSTLSFIGIIVVLAVSCVILIEKRGARQ